MSDPKVFYYLIEMGGLRMTVIGGELEDSGNGNVWLTGPIGNRILEVPRACVTLSNKQETAQRILDDARYLRKQRAKN